MNHCLVRSPHVQGSPQSGLIWHTTVVSVVFVHLGLFIMGFSFHHNRGEPPRRQEYSHHRGEPLIQLNTLLTWVDTSEVVTLLSQLDLLRPENEKLTRKTELAWKFPYPIVAWGQEPDFHLSTHPAPTYDRLMTTTSVHCHNSPTVRLKMSALQTGVMSLP